MGKRLIPTILIAAGVLLAVTSAAYWQFRSAIDNPGIADVPETIAGLSLSQASYGLDAVSEVTRLHEKSFPLSSGTAAMYGQSGEMVMLWVTGTPAQPLATKMIADMETAIGKTKSPFTPVGVRNISDRAVYELNGMGQKHFYFQSAASVIWLAADEPIAEITLAEALDFYP
ncbi:MAG TPA: hypothetical protein VFI27_06775 [candidate division Zixibacteria bacterium]|nr:hypothetical protein [candidate division Zixibacteria bacterium]